MKDEDNNCDIPECGAIFMSNSITKREIFDRNVFALPSSKANFVKQIKTGMILFLFDYESRKLYGVFQATSDGEMDIVPRGFRYSGRRFPAQVRFKTIWFCHPLNEKEFKDAIRENYFSNNKFKFGLSEYQVNRLLSLFNTKRVNRNHPHRLTEHVKDLAYVSSDGLKPRNQAFMEDDDNKLSSEYQADSFLRAKNRELMKRDAGNDDGEVYSVPQNFWTDNHGGLLTKKRRLDYQDRLLTCDLAENENCADRGVSRTSCIGSPVEVRRSMDCQRLVTIDRNFNDNRVDELLNPVKTESLEARRADMQRNLLFSDPNFGDGSYDQYSKIVNNYADEGNMLGNDAGLLRDCNSFDRDKPLVCNDRGFNVVEEAMNRTEKIQRLLNEELESRCQVGDEPFRSHLNRVRNSSAGGMFLDNNRKEGEHEFDIPVTGSYSENFPHPMGIERKMFYDRKIRLAEGRVSDKMFETGLSSTNYRSSGRMENVDDVPPCAGRTMSKYCSPFSNTCQIFSSSEKSLPDTPDIRIITTRLPVSQNHHNPSSTFDDPATTIVADPCICELMKAAQRCHASEAADSVSSFGQESHQYSLPKSSPSQFLPEPFNCSKFMDQQLERAIPLSQSLNPSLSRHGVPHTYTPDDNLYTSNGQLQTASQYVSDHSTCNNHMESKEDIICFKSNNISQGAAYSPIAIDLSRKEHQNVSDASTQSVPNTTRRSVFTRLKRPPVDEDRNNGRLNDLDHCMEASADEVMEMLLPGNNLPLRMPNNPIVDAEPKKPAKFNLNKNHLYCHIDLTTQSMSEGKNMDNSFLSIKESVDEVPEESRVVDFKRRNKKQRSLVGSTYESSTDINVTITKGEAGNPTRRKKLVRPLFGKTESASEVIGLVTAAPRVSELTNVCDDKQSCQVQIVSNDKSEMQINDASLCSHEYPHDKKNNHSEERKYLSVENCGLQVTHVGDDKQNCQKSISNDKSEVQTSLSSHESPRDKKNNRSKEQMYLGAENSSLQVTHVGDHKQIDDASLSSHTSPHDKKNNHIEEQKDLGDENCSLQLTRGISNKSEVRIDNASISGQESSCDKKNNHSEKQKDLGVGNFSLQVIHVGDDEQNSQKSISNLKDGAKTDDANLCSDKFSHDDEQKDLGDENCSLVVTRVGNDKQNCQKDISKDKGVVQKNDHFEEQVLGGENRSLQVRHEKTTQEQNCSLENSTTLPKEVDSLEKLKPDASCSSNSREGKKVRLVKRIVKKIVKIRNAKIRPGKGQNFINEKDKPSSENTQSKSEVL